jgi:predicted  nucleic acid-binding Zn-ribbon protein
MTATCAGCGTLLRSKRQWICQGCIAAAERAFRIDHSPSDQDWVRARNGVFGNMAAFLSAVQTGREMAGAA